MNLSGIPGRSGFPVEPFIGLNDGGLRTVWSQEGNKGICKLPNLNCLGEIHLLRVAGLFPLAIFCVSFYFISLFGREFLLIFCLFVYFYLPRCWWKYWTAWKECTQGLWGNQGPWRALLSCFVLDTIAGTHTVPTWGYKSPHSPWTGVLHAIGREGTTLSEHPWVPGNLLRESEFGGQWSIPGPRVGERLGFPLLPPRLRKGFSGPAAGASQGLTPGKWTPGGKKELTELKSVFPWKFHTGLC